MPVKKNADKLPKGIRLRGKKYFWDTTYKGERRTGTADTLGDAIREKANAKFEMTVHAANGTVNIKPWTLKKAYELTVALRWSESNSLETAQLNAKVCLDFFGEEHLIKDITEEDVDAFRLWLRKKGNKNSTINRKTSALSVMLSFAYSRRALVRIPAIGRLPEHNTLERYITQQEEAAVIRAMKHFGYTGQAEAVIVLIDTGIRTSEIFTIRRCDVYFSADGRGSISIWKQNTKGKQSRTVPMTSRVAQIIKDRMNRTADGDGLLFPNTKAWLRSAWDRVRAYIGIDTEKDIFYPHLLRHTFGSRLAQRGVPIQKIAYLMGHTNIKTTMRYAHLSPQSFEGIIDVLEPPLTCDKAVV